MDLFLYLGVAATALSVRVYLSRWPIRAFLLKTPGAETIYNALRPVLSAGTFFTILSPVLSVGAFYTIQACVCWNSLELCSLLISHYIYIFWELWIMAFVYWLWWTLGQVIAPGVTLSLPLADAMLFCFPLCSLFSFFFSLQTFSFCH